MKTKDELRFESARKGDMLLSPFQCDICWFINLQGREPESQSPSDQRLLEYIRRVNLDMFWSSEPSTVGATLGNQKKSYRMSQALDLVPLTVPQGPWPVGDPVGFQVAIETLRASQEKGRNDAGYVQFDTIHKIRAGYTNALESSPPAALDPITFKGDHGRSFHFSKSPLDSILFRKFMFGLEKRMGRVVYQDLAISVEVLMTVLEEFEIELRLAKVAQARKHEIIMCGAAYVVLFAGALRGGEVLLMEGSELCRRIVDGKHHLTSPHVVVPLMGRFKEETGERNVLLALVSESENCALPIRIWIERLV